MQSELKEGYYYLKTKDKSELPVLVHGYYCTDAGGVFGYGFNTYDGGGFVAHNDLTDNTIVEPVEIIEREKAHGVGIDRT